MYFSPGWHVNLPGIGRGEIHGDRCTDRPPFIVIEGSRQMLARRFFLYTCSVLIAPPARVHHDPISE
jgi:hypothetical protein